MLFKKPEHLEIDLTSEEDYTIKNVRSLSRLLNCSEQEVRTQMLTDAVNGKGLGWLVS